MMELSGKASENGINMVSFNHFAYPGETDCRLLDISQNEHLSEVIDYTFARFSKNGQCDIYLAGFSVGGNYCLKYAGSEYNDKVKAIIAISNPYDLYTLGHKLQGGLGIFNKIIAWSIHRAFNAKQFKNVDIDFSAADKWDVPSMDEATRVKLLGYSSHKELYDAVSCKKWISSIQQPFLIIYAKDDPVIAGNLNDDGICPKSIIQNNQNGLIIETEIGGHCDFFSVSDEGCRRFFPDLVLKYIQDVEDYNNRLKE